MPEAVVFDTPGGPDVLRVRPWRTADPGPARCDSTSSTAAAADDGTAVIYGFFDDQPAPLPQRRPMKIVAQVDFTMTQNPYRLASVRSFLGDGFTSGALIPPIDRIFDGLHDVVEAHQLAASGRPFGKFLIRVNR